MTNSPTPEVMRETNRDEIFDVLAEFVNQISDDVLRESLESALERMMPEEKTEIGHD